MKTRSPNLAMSTGLAAAFGASLCCVMPLLLVSIGISGAWLSSLRVFEPARPLFILVAVVALVMAYRQIFAGPENSNSANCEPEQACANPVVQKQRKLLFYCVSAAALLLLASPYLIALTG